MLTLTLISACSGSPPGSGKLASTVDVQRALSHWMKVGWDNPHENRKTMRHGFGDGEPRRLWRQSAELVDGVAVRRHVQSCDAGYPERSHVTGDRGRIDLGARHQMRL